MKASLFSIEAAGQDYTERPFFKGKQREEEEKEEKMESGVVVCLCNTTLGKKGTDNFINVSRPVSQAEVARSMFSNTLYLKNIKWRVI